jgi:hypothetical protein
MVYQVSKSPLHQGRTYLVKPQPKDLYFWVLLTHTSPLGNDLLTKVPVRQHCFGSDILVDKSSGTELGLVESSMTKDLGETPLMMVISVFLGRVDSSNVDDDI